MIAYLFAAALAAQTGNTGCPPCDPPAVDGSGESNTEPEFNDEDVIAMADDITGLQLAMEQKTTEVQELRQITERLSVMVYALIFSLIGLAFGFLIGFRKRSA
ncbi:MAG: hypothetical protein AAB692_04360 [Patescibacteria group bacterium]